MGLRSRWFFPFAILIAACSGAASTDLLGPGSESSANFTEPPPASSSGSTSSSSSTSSGSTSSSSSSTSSSSGNSSGGSSGETDAGPPEPIDAAPPPCVQEQEDNDDAQSANPFTTRFCGKINERYDQDYGKIALPPNTTAFTYNWTDTNGTVNVRIFAGPIPVSSGGGEVKVMGGVTYYVEVRNSGSSQSRPTYEVNITPK